MTPEETRIAVAEKMGWKDIHDGKGFHKSVSDELAKVSGGIWHTPIPAYDTDANAALTLVDALAKDGWRCTMNLQGMEWEVKFYKFPSSKRGRIGKYTEVKRNSESICVSICRAYLAATA